MRLVLTNIGLLVLSCGVTKGGRGEYGSEDGDKVRVCVCVCVFIWQDRCAGGMLCVGFVKCNLQVCVRVLC